MSLEFSGHGLTLRFTTLPGFHSLPERFMPYWVLGSGLLISVLAFVITLLQTRALTAARRHGADAQAAERRLRLANERFELAASAVTSAIYDYSFRTGTLVWTQGLTELAGYRVEEAGPASAWWLERVHPDDQARVQGGHVHAPIGHRHAAVVGAATDDGGRGHLVLVAPELLSGPRIHRDRMAERGGQVHDPVHDEGRGLEGTDRPARLIHPARYQGVSVLRVDLL